MVTFLYFRSALNGNDNILRPDIPSKCTYDMNKPDAISPHHHIPVPKRPTIGSNILEFIGNTPLVRLNKIPKEEGVECEILVKCEYFNPGGSVKDRIAKRMVEEGELSGEYHHGDALIEPTSGNTGIGLALASAVKGYNCYIVMPDKMSQEKSIILKSLGAKVIRTPREAVFDDPESHLQRSAALKEELSPGAHIPNQYSNPYNPVAHYDATGQEILDACAEAQPDGKPKIDMIICGAGTGGTVTGIGHLFKTKFPSCKIVAVDPRGSVLSETCLGPDDFNGAYEVEGIGYEFVPTVLCQKAIDDWVRVEDKEAFAMARRLIRSEGLLVGGSSGSAVVGAIKAIKKAGLGKGHRVVVLLPDSCHNYLTKFISDSWMIANDLLPYNLGGYYDEESLHVPVGEYLKSKHKEKIPQIENTCTLKDAKALTGGKLSMVTRNGSYYGIYDPSQILQKLLTGEVDNSTEVGKVVDKSYKRVKKSDPMSKVLRFAAHFPYVIVIGDETSEGAYKIECAEMLGFGQ
ncbi:unnamed protein product [Hymenolepis diminuta]|uniref:cystathionine beta-synthase n=1 Tax=Hymenolepis diminuta TaxID=6216 RepID=A0A0R3S9N0_HYMDI|nr:unnamed protein product [Hymenolepis diminuta]